MRRYTHKEPFLFRKFKSAWMIAVTPTSAPDCRKQFWFTSCCTGVLESSFVDPIIVHAVGAYKATRAHAWYIDTVPSLSLTLASLLVGRMNNAQQWRQIPAPYPYASPSPSTTEQIKFGRKEQRSRSETRSQLTGLAMITFPRREA
jgi:hypothetical protein